MYNQMSLCIATYSIDVSTRMTVRRQIRKRRFARGLLLWRDAVFPMKVAEGCYLKVTIAAAGIALGSETSRTRGI